MALRVKVEGLKALDRQLGRLSEAGAVKALRAALQKQARPIVRDARAKVEKDSGALAAAIGTFSRRGNDGTRITVTIGPKKKNKKALALYLQEHPDRADAEEKQNSGQVIRHGHLIEFGTRNAPARPYLRPAFDGNVENVISGFRADLAASIAKIAARE